MRSEYVTCNICGSDKAKPIGKRTGPNRSASLETNIVKCLQCGLLYPNPMPRFDDREIQKNFDRPEEYFPQDTERRLEPFQNILRELEKLKPHKGRILDVGCGRGEFSHVASLRGWEAVGTDISEAFVGYAKKTFGVNAYAGDLQKIEIQKESFDAACLISVIQYVQDPKKTFEKIHDVLKKDGILYIETTNEDALVFRIGDVVKSLKEHRRETTHLSPLCPSYQMYGFNKKSLQTALRQAGFKIVYMKIGGMRGAGSLRGDTFGNALLNFARKIIVFIGGFMGMGHLIFCIARKGD